VSLSIKYHFNQSTEASQSVKKRKMNENIKTKAILDYSLVKIPAAPFLKYLQTHCSNFLEDCKHV